MANRLQGYSWDMKGYSPRTFQIDSEEITEEETQHAFRLFPEPDIPKMKSSEYILRAQQNHEVFWVFLFLYHHEEYFNKRIYAFRGRDDRWQPNTRFLDMKLACRETVLERFTAYDPSRGANFLTYIYPFINNTLLHYRMQEEAWSFSSLSSYKTLRRVSAMYAANRNDWGKTIEQLIEKNGCTEEKAYEYLNKALGLRNQALSMHVKHGNESDDDDNDNRDPVELYPDHWDYASVLWDGMQAETIEKAYNKQSFRDQRLLEYRNAICMHCGRVSPITTRATFDELASMFEGSSPDGAERAYNRAVEKLTLELVKADALHCVKVRQKSVQYDDDKKIAAAVYEYQVDNGGNWGMIQFDFVNHEAEVIDFPKKDTDEHPTWDIEDAVINAVWDSEKTKLIKSVFLPVEKNN